MNRRLKRLNGELGLRFTAPPFELDAKQVCRQVHDILVTEKRERKLYMKQKIKFAAVLVAAVVALTGTALAVGPTVWEAIQQALGDFAPYAYEVEGISATDQGIEVKVVSALSDQLNARAYLEVRDLKGSRIDGDDAKISFHPDLEWATPREGSSFQVELDCISYDPDTRTALYELKLNTHYQLLAGAPIQLNIDAFELGIQTVGYAFLPEELPGDQALKTKTLSTGETVLTPNQTPVELAEKEYENKNYVPKGMKGVKLSSMGFGTDGLLHIQFQMPKEALEEHCRMGVTVYNGDWGSDEMFYYNDRTDTTFYEGKTLYYDICYPITKADMKDVHIEEAHGSFRSEAQIDGEWNLSIPMEEAPVREITMNETISGTLVKKLSLTALSAYVEIEDIPGAYQQYYVPYLPLTIYLKDGTIKTLGRSGWSYKEPIDPEQVTGVAIGMWMIPFHENTGGPGHWLSELPQ